MKNMLIYILLSICFNIVSISTQANNNKTPIFIFKPAPNEKLPDSIALIFRKGTLPSVSSTELIRKHIPEKDKSFIFSPSFIQPVYMVQIVFYYTENNRMKHSYEDYYAEPNDQITITYKKHTDHNKVLTSVLPKMSFTFSGKGSTKYRVCEILNNIKAQCYINENENLSNEIKNGFNSPDYYKTSKCRQYLVSFAENIKSADGKSRDTLYKYRNHLSINLKTFLSYELKPSHEVFPVFIDFLFRKAKSDSLKHIISDFYFLNKQAFVLEPKDSLVIYSKVFKDYKLWQIMIESDFKSGGKGFSFVTQYDEIKKVKNQNLRDILITLFLHQRYFQQRISNKDTQDSCIIDAITMIKSPQLVTVLNDQLLYKRGGIVPDFSFADIKGDETRLTNLKGKVFMIDFYFYGCKGCAQFAEIFKTQVYPEFSNNPSFKILSVNIDSKKEFWIKAMESGLYNEKTYLNLSTGISGPRHPFLQYYKITGFPFVLLIDKDGKLIARIDSSNPKNIKVLIRQALMPTTESK